MSKGFMRLFDVIREWLEDDQGVTQTDNGFLDGKDSVSHWADVGVLQSAKFNFDLPMRSVGVFKPNLRPSSLTIHSG